ncbi:DUF3017 domain-containing protein [Streptomyces sp. V1I1]|uniref:DUF3017 domain-containing protein n=1 Tax=Streptomyces sp. V1I1 TaxID=3042272 RepID=UPI00278A0580|nr:DUF3017 domain-containing protein [Streptomyces sp. V1I1]MDQ0941291.1 hypothetical protein [Streptomyces sp. V1I1]
MGVRTNDAAGADDRGAAAPLAEGAASAAGSAGAPEPGAEDRAAGNADGRDAIEPASSDADGRDAVEPASSDADGRDAVEPASSDADGRDAVEPASSDADGRDAVEPASSDADGRDAVEPASSDADGRDAVEPASTDADGRDAVEPSAAPDANGRTGPHHKRPVPAVGAAVAAALAEAVHPRPGRPDAGDQSGIEARVADAGHTPDTSQDHRTAQPAAPGKAPSRRPPSLTRDTARPEGGGRAAPGGAPAPARQWPLLTVLALTGLGLVVVGTDAFAEAFRVGTILIGVALLTGAVLRRMLPSVGMLAVRSRFTDMVTYGVLGILIVLLALVTQPKPWLDVPFLEDAVHFTVR